MKNKINGKTAEKIDQERLARFILIGFLEPVQNSRVPHHLFKFRFSFAAPSVSPLRFDTI
jgi:hypothetical protein